jgi:hypothetical protein
VVRILNLLCAGMMLGFEVWYLIELFQDGKGFFVLFIRIFTPLFVMYSPAHAVSSQSPSSPLSLSSPKLSSTSSFSSSSRDWLFSTCCKF